MNPWAMMRVGGVARHSGVRSPNKTNRRPNRRHFSGRCSDCSPGIPWQGPLHENMILDQAKPLLAFHVPALGKFPSLMPGWPCASGRLSPLSSRLHRRSECECEVDVSFQPLRRVLGEIVKVLNLKHLSKKKAQQSAEHSSAKWPNATRVKSNTLGGVCLV